MNNSEHPGPDADASEIAEWMEEDFGRALAEGIESVADEDDTGNDSGTVEVEILNYHQSGVVGTIDTNGNLSTKSEELRDASRKYLERGVPVLVSTTHENEDGETVQADDEHIIEPGTKGFVRAFVDELPSPFDCASETLADLPAYCDE